MAYKSYIICLFMCLTAFSQAETLTARPNRLLAEIKQKDVHPRFLSPDPYRILGKYKEASYLYRLEDQTYYIYNTTSMRTYNIDSQLKELCNITKEVRPFLTIKSNLYCVNHNNSDIIKLKVDLHDDDVITKDKSYDDINITKAGHYPQIGKVNDYDERIYMAKTTGASTKYYEVDLGEANITHILTAYNSWNVPTAFTRAGDLFIYVTNGYEVRIFNMTKEKEVGKVHQSNTIVKRFIQPVFLGEDKKSIIMPFEETNANKFDYLYIRIDDDGKVKHDQGFSYYGGKELEYKNYKGDYIVNLVKDENILRVLKANVTDEGKRNAERVTQFPFRQNSDFDLYVDVLGDYHFQSDTVDAIVDFQTDKIVQINSTKPYLTGPPIKLPSNNTLRINQEGFYFFDEKDDNYNETYIKYEMNNFYLNSSTRRIYALKRVSDTTHTLCSFDLDAENITEQWNYTLNKFPQATLIDVHILDTVSNPELIISNSTHYFYVSNDENNDLVIFNRTFRTNQTIHPNWDDGTVAFFYRSKKNNLYRYDFDLQNGQLIEEKETVYTSIQSLVKINRDTIILAQVDEESGNSIIIVHDVKLQQAIRSVNLKGKIRMAIHADFQPYYPKKISGFYSIDDEGTLKHFKFDESGSIKVQYETTFKAKSFSALTVANSTVFQDISNERFQAYFTLGQLATPNDNLIKKTFDWFFLILILIIIILICVILIVIIRLKKKKEEESYTNQENQEYYQYKEAL